MKIKKLYMIGTAMIAPLLLISCDSDTRNLIANLPKDQNVLFWTIEQRDAAFRVMEKLVDYNEIKAGDNVMALPAGDPLDLDVTQYMADQRTAGLIIIHDGQIRLEKYGLDFTQDGRWTSFSVAKSFTSTLVGAAIKDGHIKNIDDKVSDYIADLKGSAYDDVTIEQLLTMTSGVAWTEDYEDPKSDVALFINHEAEDGLDVTVSYMRKLKREAPAGEKWVYKTGETNLIGVLVSEATGKTLSDYLTEKIWQPYGMETDAVWMTGTTGHEIAGCCISATLRDYARFGMFIMNGAKVNGEAIVPDDWIAKATTSQVGKLSDERGDQGYGYQWWTGADRTYAAQGIFGQGIFIDPARNLIIATNSNWPTASAVGAIGQQRLNFYKAVQTALDAEQELP